MGKGAENYVTTANGSHEDENMVDEIMQSKNQPEIHDEVEGIEAFQRQVDSERERLMTMLQQLQAKEYVL